MPPFDQSTYQVRLDWGLEGLARLAPADVVVVVDVLRFSTTVIRALENDAAFCLDAAAFASSINGAAVAAAAADTGAVVLLGALRNASAVAAAVYAEQRRAGRTSVNVVAAGERSAREAGSSVRFAVEDQLGAGAIIDALATLGLDHSSPEAAVTGEAFRALRRATRHLLTAGGSGRELAGLGRGDEVDAAAAVDAASVVPILREGVFGPL
ncbi:2-phosphosulfolactate phosphatase [Microbacterium terregens]|uniref:Probable 2-phosphosulfolactate phosphatase n=1 Tax=Microbacterium terregens TaxID=69363 RepID=A0ABV5SX17_9MICO